MESIRVVKAQKAETIWWVVDGNRVILSTGRFPQYIQEGDWFYLLVKDTDVLAICPIPQEL